MTDKSEHSLPAPAVLITQDSASPWRLRLAQSGLSVRLLLPESVPNFLSGLMPPVLFFDIRCDVACHEAVRDGLARRGPSRPLLIALLPSEKGRVTARDLQRANVLGASDILLDESPDAAVAARVHFALLKAAAVVDPDASASRPSAEAAEDAAPAGGADGAAVLDHAEFRSRLTDYLAGGEAAPPVSVIIVDLDRFKAIVTRFGRERADQILELTAERLAAACAATNRGRCLAFAQLQADTFALAATGPLHQREAAAVAERMLEAIGAPIEIGGQTLYLQASAGIAAAPQDALGADGLLHAAQSALSHAKRRAGSLYAFYSPHLAAGQAQRLELEHRLRTAMAGDELEIHYQPIAEVATGRIVGLEALLRWRHPEIGLVSPEQFIAIAEESGLAADLSGWALQTAARTLRVLETQGLPPLRLAINIPPDVFGAGPSDSFADFVFETLRDTGLPAECLVLEMTERTLAEGSEEALASIGRLKQAGVHLALDDFGTGYASFAALKTFPVDELKIDRSLVAGDDGVELALMRAILTLAKSLGMRVTAEGVENAGQLARLAEEGCDLYQGYLRAAPMPGDRLAEYLPAAEGSSP